MTVTEQVEAALGGAHCRKQPAGDGPSDTVCGLTGYAPPPGMEWFNVPKDARCARCLEAIHSWGSTSWAHLMGPK